MRADDVLAEFEAAGGLLRGHFILTSGRHSDTYLNKSAIAQYPERCARLCAALAAKIETAVGGADVIVSPALGAIVFGYETAKTLGARFFFLERDGEGFALRRGYAFKPGERVVIVEDIISTGLSARACVKAVEAAGAEPLALACLINRSGGGANVGAPVLALTELSIPTYAPDETPETLRAIPAVKPGSRA
ncbi:MAG: orotate phosphoribosyltransferase [Pseudomonadota bacterium]